MAAATALNPGFADPIHDAQRVFRAALQALSRPGLAVALDVQLQPPAPLSAQMAGLVLALADFETRVWLDAPLRVVPAVRNFLTFHTGAAITQDPSEADFACVSDLANMPALSAFKQGTLEYPDRSTTIFVAVEALSSGPHVFEGPGINGEVAFGVVPEFATFQEQLRANRAAFPLGVDLIFSVAESAGAAGAIAALPRSSRLRGGL